MADNPTIQPELLTDTQVMAILNIKKSLYYQMKRSGQFALLPVALCSKSLYRRDELLKWISFDCRPDRKQWQMWKEAGKV